MITKREKLLKNVADLLKQKALSYYRYGGYIFYPDGTIEKRKANITTTQYNGVLRVHSAVSTVASDTDWVHDLYLLTDLLDVLRGESPSIGNSFNQMFAEHAIKEEEEEQRSWDIGTKLLEERSTVAKYLRGIENLPIHIEPTPDFDGYMKSIRVWSEARSKPEENKKLYDFLKKCGKHYKKKKSVKV